MGFSTVVYNEGKQSSYKAIKLSHHVGGEELVKLFNTGNFIVDFYEYMRFLGNQDDQWYKDNFHIIGSSSWDHFFMDGNKYHESYFDPKTGEFLDWRGALDMGNYGLYDDIINKGKYPRVVHLKSQKNFDAVKKYYRKMMRNYKLEKLQAGETVTTSEKGNSMVPLIKSGQEHILEPATWESVEVGDIVYCKVHGRMFTHLVKAKNNDKGCQIGNNHGHINGWTKQVFGKVIKVL